MSERAATIDELLAEARAELDRVAPEDVRDRLADGAVLVDIRSDAQRASDGVIADAVYIPRNVLEWRADPRSGFSEPSLGDADTPLILFCNEGYQSSLAAATLRRLGRDATDVIGGFVSMRGAGFTVAASPE